MITPRKSLVLVFVFLLLLPGAFAAQPITGTPVPLSPVNTVLNWFDGLTYTWEDDPQVEWYHLWVTYYGNPSAWLERWVPSAEVCGGGVCTLPTFAVTKQGAYGWWLQAWSSAGGYSAWTAEIPFGVAYTRGPTMLGPSGWRQLGAEVYFEWDTLPTAEWYHLWISDPQGSGSEYWYSAADARCQLNGSTFGTDKCSIPMPISDGVYRWWVQAWSSRAGYSPWSGPLQFLRAQTSSGLTAPRDDAVVYDTTPTLQFPYASDVDWYYLQVSARGQEVFHEWYAPGAICSPSGCALESPVTLGYGDNWWRFCEWNNQYGYRNDCGGGYQFTVSSGAHVDVGLSNVNGGWRNDVQGVGQPTEYNLVMTNHSADLVTDLVIDTDLEQGFSPDRLGEVSVSGVTGQMSWSFDETQGRFSLSELPGGAVVELRVTVIPGVAPPPVTAWIAALNEVDVNSGNDSVTTRTLSVSDPVDLEMTAAWTPDQVMVPPDAEAVYRLSVFNHGATAQTDVRYRVQPEAADTAWMFLVGSSASENYDPQTGIWSIPMIEPGTAAVLELTAQLPTPGVWCMEAWFVGSSFANALTETLTYPPYLGTCLRITALVDLTVRADWDANPVMMGEANTFTVTVGDVGGGTATNVWVYMTMCDVLLECFSDTIDGRYWVYGSGLNIAELQGEDQFTVWYRPRYHGEITGEVYIWSLDQVDPNPANDRFQTDILYVNLP